VEGKDDMEQIPDSALRPLGDDEIKMIE